MCVCMCVVCECVCVSECVCVRACVCNVAIAIVKRPVLPLYVEEGRCRIFSLITIIFLYCILFHLKRDCSFFY